MSVNGSEKTLLLEEALVRLKEAEGERAEAGRTLEEALRGLGMR